MLKAENKKIIMTEGDFGITLPLIFKGDLEESDTIKFIIKKQTNDSNSVLIKDFDNLSIEDNTTTCNLSFTKEESELLKNGYYQYGIKQYRDGKLLNTIVTSNEFDVIKGV